MIPRGAPYIGWSDLAAATFNCLRTGDAAAVHARVEARWAPNTVALLSVRSGLDALFQVLALSPDSEVILSAITIPHILDILAHHRLIAVPVDIDPGTLSVSSGAVRDAITARTKAVLVAHLFGSRMPLDDIVAIAKAHDLLLIEDCAQANDGTDYRGHPGADVSMFSFGSIKRQTALGGGLLRFRDAALAQRVRDVQAAYPALPRRTYFERVLTMTFIKAVATRAVFRAFVAACRITGRDHDQTLGTALRGFKHGDLFARLRQRPGAPLLRTLERRLRSAETMPIAQRMAVVSAVSAAYPNISRAGRDASHHTHWLFPLSTPEPDRLMHYLWREGFDATRGASNLVHVPAPAGRPEPRGAMRMMSQVLYLPLFPTATTREMERMASAVRTFDSATDPTTRPATASGLPAASRSA